MSDIEYIEEFENKDATAIALSAALLGSAFGLARAHENRDSIESLQRAVRELKGALRDARDEYRRFFSDVVLTEIYADIIGVQDTLALWDGTPNDRNVADAYPLVRSNYARILTYMFNQPGFLSDEDMIKLVELHDVNLTQQSTILLSIGKPFQDPAKAIENLNSGATLAKRSQEAVYRKIHGTCSGYINGGYRGEPIIQKIGYLDETGACVRTATVVGDDQRQFSAQFAIASAERDAIISGIVARKTAEARQPREEFRAEMVKVLSLNL